MAKKPNTQDDLRTRNGYITALEAISKYNIHPELLKNAVAKNEIQHFRNSVAEGDEIYVFETEAAEKLAHRSYISRKSKIAAIAGGAALSIGVAVSSTAINNAIHAERQNEIGGKFDQIDKILSLYFASTQLILEFEGRSAADLSARYGARRSVAERRKSLKPTNEVDYILYSDHFFRLASDNPIGLFDFFIQQDFESRLTRAVRRNELRVDEIDGQVAYIGSFTKLFELWEQASSLGPDSHLSSVSQAMVDAIEFARPSSGKISHGTIRLSAGGSRFRIPTKSDPQHISELALRNSFMQSSFALFLYSLQEDD